MYNLLKFCVGAFLVFVMFFIKNNVESVKSCGQYTIVYNACTAQSTPANNCGNTERNTVTVNCTRNSLDAPGICVWPAVKRDCSLLGTFIPGQPASQYCSDDVPPGQSGGLCFGAPPQSCLSSWPSCSGEGCASNQYCAVRVSNPKECVCKERTGDGCYGGWVWVGPGDSIRRCCVVTAPSAPSLVSPANGAQLSSGNVSLQWSPPTDWGGFCPNTFTTENVKVGTSPTNLSSVYRQAAPFPTSVVVVGQNVEIAGTYFPSAGTNVLVRLEYQSAATAFSGKVQIQPGGGDYFDELVLVDMTGRPGWNASTGFGMVSWLQNFDRCNPIYKGGYGYYIIQPNWIGFSYDAGGAHCPTHSNFYAKDCGVCGSNNKGVCHSCWVSNYNYYDYNAWYTQARVHTGTYAVGSDGKIRVPVANLAGGVTSSLGIKASLSLAGTGLSLSFAPGTYYWKVEADNGTTIPGNPSSSPIWSFTISAAQTMTGNVYYDPNNTCSTSTPSGFDGNLNVRYTTVEPSTYNAGVAASGANTGRFSITTSGNTSGTLSLQNLPAGYLCSTGCSQSCPTKTGVLSPSVNNNFFITSQRSAWWQAVGGGIYAGASTGGTTIKSEIPVSVPIGGRHLVLPGAGGTAAAVLRASGNVNTGAGQVSGSGWSAMTTYKGKRMDYKFFANQLGVTFTQSNDWSSNSLDKPSYSASKGFYYQKPSVGTATIANAWNVASGESYVVLVDGNLRIDANVVVANGGFVAFIVSGNIVVDSQVTQLEGLYLASGSFSTLSAGSQNDAQLRVGGSVVAWGGVNLARDMGLGNVSNPAELFTHRQDLLRNMPNNMKIFVMTWEEVPSGTFGN